MRLPVVFVLLFIIALVSWSELMMVLIVALPHLLVSNSFKCAEMLKSPIFLLIAIFSLFSLVFQLCLEQ